MIESISIRDFCIKILTWFQTMMDFAWKAAGVERDGSQFIIPSYDTSEPIERTYTFHVKEGVNSKKDVQKKKRNKKVN